MTKFHANVLQPASKNTVQAILEKHRGTVPEKSSSKAAPQKGAGGVTKAASEPAVNTTASSGSGAGAKKQKPGTVSKQAKVSRVGTGANSAIHCMPK